MRVSTQQRGVEVEVTSSLRAQSVCIVSKFKQREPRETKNHQPFKIE